MQLHSWVAFGSLLIFGVVSSNLAQDSSKLHRSEREESILRNLLGVLIERNLVRHPKKSLHFSGIISVKRDPETHGKNATDDDLGNDNEGDVDNSHDYVVLGKKGDSEAVHDKYRKDHITNAHTDNTEGVIQDQEEECKEYYHQIEMAIKHGRKPEDVPKPDVDCEIYQNEKRMNGRSKRFAAWNPGVWDKGIVPFLFDVESLSDERAQFSRIRAHNHYEYWTCLRFIPYTETTQNDYGLSHNNYLRHLSTGGCSSSVGNLVKKNGQNINCCGNDICVHELGHAFGLHHEQKNPLHDNYLSVNYNNIKDEYKSQYYESNIKRSRLFGYYDLSNVMHYGMYGFTNGGPTMSVFDPDLKYLVRKTDPYQFYLFSEVSQITDCKGLKCSDFSLTCHNSGYQAYIKDQCTCRCPEGLDPALGCRTRYDGDRMLASQWPSDSFTILGTQTTGCPSGFYEGSITQHHKDTKQDHVSSIFSADVISEPTSTAYNFCTKKKTAKDATSLSWPAGKYCIYRKDEVCPPGFTFGYIQYDDLKNPSNISGILPDGQFESDSRFYFCCRGDGSTSSSINLPSSEPFIMFPSSRYCQEVTGMSSSRQFLRIKNDKELLHTNGDIPYMTISYTVNYKLHFCYYTPLGFDVDSISYSRWPTEPFSLIQASTGCPKGFEPGQFVEYSYYSSVSSDTYSALTSSDQSFQYQFCTKPQTSPIGEQTTWGPGSYCMIRSGGSCPKGFSEGTISLMDSQPPSDISGSLPDGSYDDSVTLHFCCREDGFTRNPLLIPNKEPFILFKKNSACQKVDDMSFEEETYSVGTKNKVPIKSGQIPIISTRYGKVDFYFCYYYPTTYDCGETIHLSTAGQTTFDISSPQYPLPYPSGRKCYWNVIAPPGSKLKLDFYDFDIVANSDGTCEDRLEIRHSLPGQFGLSYCGDRFPDTIITEKNQLGLTFETSLRNSAKGFSARVTLLNENDSSFCYTNNGENYRGTVDITRRFAKCVPWSEVKHCLSSTYNPMDLDDDLLNNYCRNPGHGTRPWCITNKYMCTRGYCDVCGIEKCYDIFDDCVERVTDTLSCERDPELQRSCRMSCNLCNRQPATGVGSVTCGMPVVPSDSTSGVLKESYSVDETVVLSCETNAFETQTITCLADGTWSNAGFSCGRCKTGWIPYQGQCYKAFYDEVDRDTAVTRCASENNAILASSRDQKENGFLTSLVQDGVPFWIGIKDNLWADGEPVEWTNYKSGATKSCAYITDGNGKWKGTGCSSAYYIPYVCSYSPQARKICKDATDNCVKYVNADAQACTNDEFVWHTCPETCGYCNQIEDNCPVPSITLESNTELVNADSALAIGDVLQYRCKSGYSHTQGDLYRACKRSGSFTGELPQCSVSSTVPEPNNNAPLLSMGKSLSTRFSFIGMNEMMTIQKSGKLVKWQFYSETDGTVALQVWRPTSTDKTYTLIGQNEIRNSFVGGIRTFEVPTENQIDVQNGDIIGIFSLSAEIPFERCDTATNGETYGSVVKSVSKKYSVSGWSVSTQYTFQDVSDSCRIIPVTAFIM